MSSAPTRTQPRLRRVAHGLVWAVLLAVLAASAAGLVGETWHAPGSPARAELTWAGDTALDARLDLATAELNEIALAVDELANEAKIALSEVSSVDQSRLQAAIRRGGQAAASVEARTRSLRESVVDLPGDGPAAAMEYSNATLVRRAAVIAAIEAAGTLAGQWRSVTARSAEAATLNSLITRHDRIFLDAAELGRNKDYEDAAAVLDEALLTITEVLAIRTRLVASSEQTVLDEWIERTRDYDLAVKAVYLALERSGGRVTVEVQSARREEQAAFARLPPDRRTIVVIISEVARGGLTQAVIAIEDAHGHIDDAIAEAEAQPDATPFPQPS